MMVIGGTLHKYFPRSAMMKITRVFLFFVLMQECKSAPSKIIENRLSDVNDNGPVFAPTDVYIFLITDSSPGVQIGQVKAIDRDMGEKQRITYAVVENRVFTANEISGKITILDQTMFPTNFLVEACYNSIGDSSRRCSHASVQVIKHDNNTTDGADNVRATITIAENEPPGTILADINFQNDQARLTVVESNLYFYLDKNLLKNRIVFDREAIPRFQLRLRADNGTAYIDNYLIDADVIDRNDNSPLFPQSHYTFDVPADAQVGTIIGRVTATDADRGENAVVRYEIQGDCSRQFGIGEYTGEISLVKLPDKNSSQPTIVYLTVRATDGGTPPLHSTTRIMVNFAGKNIIG